MAIVGVGRYGRIRGLALGLALFSWFGLLHLLFWLCGGLWNEDYVMREGRKEGKKENNNIHDVCL